MGQGGELLRQHSFRNREGGRMNIYFQHYNREGRCALWTYLRHGPKSHSILCFQLNRDFMENWYFHLIYSTCYECRNRHTRKRDSIGLAVVHRQNIWDRARRERNLAAAIMDQVSHPVTLPMLLVAISILDVKIAMQNWRVGATEIGSCLGCCLKMRSRSQTASQMK